MKALIKTITLSLLGSVGGALVSATESPSLPDGADMLRFANHDTLHGEFLAFNAQGNLEWKSPKSPDPIIFDTQKAHRILLNQGKAHQAIDYKSAVYLINGDIIPGSITSADDTSVILDTVHLGNLTIPRDIITRIAPTPFAGKLLYYGPLNTDGWKIMSPNLEEGKERQPAKNLENKDTEKNWQHISNAWYTGTDQTQYLVRENALSDKCKLSMKLSWRGALYANVIFHADFSPPENKNANTTAPSYKTSAMVGHAYSLNFTSHSASLTALTYGEDGKLHTQSFNETKAPFRLTGKTETMIEIRLDRPNKSILLYSDDHFIGKWALGDTYAGKGNTLAFFNPRSTKAELRISDIAISHWNGMKDSAESKSSAKRDIILLNNGLDRFSGNFKHILDGQVSFEGRYDNIMTIPVEEVHEIYLATSKHKHPPEDEKDAANDTVHFFIYPYGRITGSPTASSAGQGKTKLSTDLLGELELDTRFINIIDFSQKNSLLDIWDDNF